MSLSADKITRAEAWSLNPYYSTKQLNEAETAVLVALINSLDISKFTEDQSLCETSGEYGIVIYTGKKYYSITQSENGGYGRLAIMFDRTKWWINDDKLNEFIITKSGWKSTPTWDGGIIPAEKGP